MKAFPLFAVHALLAGNNALRAYCSKEGLDAKEVLTDEDLQNRIGDLRFKVRGEELIEVGAITDKGVFSYLKNAEGEVAAQRRGDNLMLQVSVDGKEFVIRASISKGTRHPKFYGKPQVVREALGYSLDTLRKGFGFQYPWSENWVKAHIERAMAPEEEAPAPTPEVVVRPKARTTARPSGSREQRANATNRLRDDSISKLTEHLTGRNL